MRLAAATVPSTTKRPAGDFAARQHHHLHAPRVSLPQTKRHAAVRQTASRRFQQRGSTRLYTLFQLQCVVECAHFCTPRTPSRIGCATWGNKSAARCIEEVAGLSRPMSLHAIEALGRGRSDTHHLVQVLIVLAICQDWRGRLLRCPSWECTTRSQPRPPRQLHSPLVLQPKWAAARGDRLR